MEKNLKTIAVTSSKRFAEILLVNMVLSAFVTALNFVGILNSQQQIFHALLVGVFMSLAINIALMRQCYYDLTNRMIYYTSNYIAYFLFMVVNLVVGAVFDEYVYAWMFSLAKVARFSHHQVSSLVSAFIFNGVMFISINFAPIGMGWLIMDGDYED